MVYAAFGKYLGSGPLFDWQSDRVRDCNTNWWANLLFINNFVKPREMVSGCVSSSYSLLGRVTSGGRSVIKTDVLLFNTLKPAQGIFSDIVYIENDQVSSPI